jgi:hypothetical protein
MNTDQTLGGPATGDRFDYAEALLARYPQLSADELGDLQQWFRSEASAFEVASLASKDSLREPYRRFRAEHVDRLRLKDAVIMMAGLAFVIAAITGLVLAA